MYMRNCWQVAAFSAEIISGRLFARKLLDEAVVFYRAMDGHVVALDDRCPHRFTPLSKGTLIGEILRCGYHGLCFDTTGRCIQIPGQEHIPAKARVRTYPVLERYKLVWIWMGDADEADPDEVPDVHWMDHPEWIASEGYHRVDANYKLLNDNLLDLSHETYVHQKTIGNEAVAESPAATRSEGQTVYVTKEMKACLPPPFYQYLARISRTDAVDRWQRTVFRPPGYIVIDVGVQPLTPVPGSVRVEGRVIDLITPETATSSHYFWAFARNFRLDEMAVTEYLRENVRHTFDEDKEMLEAQQRNIGADADPTFGLAVRGDAAPTLARRLLASMIASEARVH